MGNPRSELPAEYQDSAAGATERESCPSRVWVSARARTLDEVGWGGAGVRRHGNEHLLLLLLRRKRKLKSQLGWPAATDGGGALFY